MSPIHIRELILHPGSPKTGTSGLQDFLYQKQSELLDQGYLYPNSGISFETAVSRGHHKLAFQLEEALTKTDEALLDTLQYLREEIEGRPDHTLVLSSEEFFGRDRINVLQQFLKPQKCLVYVTLRPQHEVINANYYTHVTHNRSTELPDTFFNRARRNLNYLDVLDACASICEDTEVKVRLFEKGKRVRSEPVRDFMESFGISVSTSESDCRIEHATLPAQPTLFLRWLNELGCSSVEFFQAFEALHKMSPLFPRDMYTVPPQLLQSAIEDFAEENRAIRRKYVDGKNESLFLPPTDLPDQEEFEKKIGSDYLQSLRAFLIDLLRHADRNILE